MLMLWVTSFHMVFVASWFAGLFLIQFGQNRNTRSHVWLRWFKTYRLC